MEAAAYLVTVLVSLVAAFQLALAAGAPWGRAAYGGLWPGVLPRGLRINSLVFGAVVYPLVILYVLDAGGVAELERLPGSRTVIVWVFAVFFAVGTLANAFSRSKVERLWAPVTALLTLCCLVIVL